jgi:putative transposase
MRSSSWPARFSCRRSSTPSEVLNDFVDQHRQPYGVESICEVLQIAPSGYWRHAAHQRNPQLRCARAQRDETLIADIERV